MIIGLTGGIATGKSTVAEMLVKRGALLVDADQIARDVVVPGSEVLVKIETFFMEQYQLNVVQENGALDRKTLGELVFSNPHAKEALNSMIHPPIRKQIIERIQTLERENPQKLIIADIPLLFESKYDYMFDEVMLVYVSRQTQLQRLMKRDGITLEQAEQRLAAQLPIDEKRKLASVIIDNSGIFADTERQIEQFWRSTGLHETNT
jgi:dephospho-CoA kinase